MPLYRSAALLFSEPVRKQWEDKAMNVKACQLQEPA